MTLHATIAHGPLQSLLPALLILLVSVAGARPLRAQLISPGALAGPHQDLEGMRQCTSCHTLGSQGVDNNRCLGCHEPLRARVNAGRGFHASLTDRNCGDCHKEHFGTEFELVRLDTTRFDHAETGFRLTGAHTEITCRRCHRPSAIVAADVRAFKGRHGALERTFLGLADRCLTCHEADSPHDGQFAGEDCAGCHSTATWKEAEGFDHDQARFALAGRHGQVACVQCHTQERGSEGEPVTRYQGLSFATCASCHDDAHQGSFGADCARCHDVGGWYRVNRSLEGDFDHAATGFSLSGGHARLDCASCHARPARQDTSIRLTFARGTAQRTYPTIEATSCASCHVDYHAATFNDTPGGADCASCHVEDGWVPVAYDIDRHRRETDFALLGAHLATPCTACHHDPAGKTRFRFEDVTCEGCHTPDSPHGPQFAGPDGVTVCASCHGPEAWTVTADFDHGRTDYPLTGRHADVACASCHPPPDDGAKRLETRYRGLATDCMSCHAGDDPHRDQFEGRPCETCHDTASFAEATAGFEHTEARFLLTGAHAGLACENCHRKETVPGGDAYVRYRPLGLACKDCHGDG